MKKCLIATVGKGVSAGGERDVAELLSFTVKTQNPDRVVFVCTGESKGVISLLEGKLELPPYEIVLIEDLSNHDESFSKVRQKIKEKSEEGFEVTVDFTSGTKPMSAGALLAAADELVPVSYVRARRTEGKPSGPMELLVHEVSAGARSRLERLVQQLFDAHQFRACLDLIGAWVGKFPELDSWSSLIEGYYRWDIFEYDGARELLIEDRRVPPENKEFLGKFSDKGDLYFLIDLYANSQRRGEEGKFDDAVARLYSLVERIAHWRLKERYRVDPAGAPEGELPGIIRDGLKRAEDGKVKLGLKDSFLFLKEKSDPLGRYADDQRLRDLLSRRNFSPLAHGNRPVGKEVYEGLSAKVGEMLEEVVPDFRELLRKCSFPEARRLIGSK